MSEAVNSLSVALEKAYQSFILRDLLGFVLPGLISIVSLGYLLESNFSSNAFVTWLNGILVADWVKTTALLATAYLTGWILQSVHYGIIDWLFQIGRFSHKIRAAVEALEQSEWLRIWPIVGILVYMAKIANFNTQSDETRKLPPSLITRGALSPDRAYKMYHVKLPDVVSRYPERLSVLMLMTGNLAIAGSLSLFALQPNWYYWVGGIIVVLFLYLEHWRLWYTRNLQVQMHVESLREVKGQFE